MAELVPAKFSDLVTRLHREPGTDDALFLLPRKKWYLPAADDPDLSVRFHGTLAGNPSGTAAGPQTQMAQNILLSYIAGGRILELKTVQVNDHLKIARPCIDVTNIGYNIEWSQELLVEQSLSEYVAGMMLIEMFRQQHGLKNTAGEVIYDLSVGYDLEGIKSEKVQKFLDGMRDAGAEIEKLRGQIPDEFKAARELEFQKQISHTLTLSTFHGCPAGEIERICEHLIADRELDVIVKMNPPMLGKEKLEHLLHDVLGYTELTVNPTAYTSGLQYDEAVDLVDRLMKYAHARGRTFGCKFSNTLEVLNHRDFFTPENKVQYLSGQPLHVITMALTAEFRKSIGAHVPISFSAGIDRQNFWQAVACGFVPVTTCTDLLRPGGYGRLPGYMRTLCDEMKKVGARTIDEFVVKAFEKETDAKTQAADVAVRNTEIVAEKARNDPRYRAAQNRKIPVRIDSHLHTFDCITCDKCIPVCPNAANFTYPTPIVPAFECQDVIVDRSGNIRREIGKKFAIDRAMQIANYADFCNECGNCDTFCPEYGGPYIKKPAFYSSEETWRAAAPRDGFVISQSNESSSIRGRIGGKEYELAVHSDHRRFSDTFAEVTIDDNACVISARMLDPTQPEDRLDMWVFHTMSHLLSGVLNCRLTNQINVGMRV